MFGVDFNAPRYNQTVDLTNVNGQFLRLTALEGGGDRFLAIAEIEAFAQPIPEPSTLALAGIAAVAFAVARRRRRQPMRTCRRSRCCVDGQFERS
jgi:hypothetical protein